MSATLQQPVGASVGEFASFATPIAAACRTTGPQREVWLGAQLSQEASLAFNEAVSLEFDGVLDAAALVRSIEMLVARHQSLRAIFSSDGDRMLVNAGGDFEVSGLDLEALDTNSRAQALNEALRAAVHTPFDLERAPLFKAMLCRMSATRHVLVMSAHHMVCDGWSWSVMVEELGRIYAGNTGSTAHTMLPAPRFTEYAALEAAVSRHADMREHVDFWLGIFPGQEHPVLELPLDHARPAVRSFTSQRVDRLLDNSLVAQLRTAAARSGASLFTVMFGAFAATLQRVTGQEDLVIGVPAAGQLAHDMPGLVGHCVNLLPLRVAVPPRTPFSQLVRQCATTVMDAFEHQALSYGALIAELVVERDARRLPLVSVMFNLDAAAGTRAPEFFTGIDVHQSTVARSYENFELFLNITPLAGGLQMEAQYNADLFDKESVDRWLEMYETLLRSVSTDLEKPVGLMQVLSEKAASALVALQPPRSTVAGPGLMHADFVSHAALWPRNVAIEFHAQRHTYADLDAWSNQLAHALRSRGVGRGQRVGLCLERGPDMVAGLLAILKAGAAYVPLDPGFPPGRLDQYAEDARLDLLLTDSTVGSAPRQWCVDAATRIFNIDRDASWRQFPVSAPPADDRDARPEDAAYVIYTSGSTGRPKGVCVQHSAAANFIHAMLLKPGLLAGDTVAAVTTLSFDIAVAELVLPLSTGATVILVSREDAMDGNLLVDILESSRANVLQATPGTWRLLIDAGWSGTPDFKAWIGGEPVPAALALELVERTGEVWNVYGPTETTVWSTAWRMQADVIASRGMSIGQPLANTEVWILDAALQPCPMGITGEICIAGSGVAWGYLDRPHLTAERFVVVPLMGTPVRMYRTGDRGRWRNDKVLEHLGRSDFQLKVRGYRIEPGEIEARCCQMPGVSRCVVLAREDRPGDVRLVAYLAIHGEGYDAAALEHHLRSTLPGFMVPQHLVALPALPLLPNGKIDRKALPLPQAAARDKDSRLAPASELQRLVLSAMETVLTLPGLDMRDDFFMLGGHSLLAARLSTLLGKTLGMTLPMRTLFEAPTPLALAKAIEQLQDQGSDTRVPLPYLVGRTTAPLTPSQERILFVEQLHPGRSVYNTPSAQRLTGVFDAELFQAALREVARRQPALRTCIGEDPRTGAAVQSIAEEVDVWVPVIDLRHLPADQREAELMEQLQELADRPLALDKAPLFHTALFRLDEQVHVFLFVPHHLIWDGWSFDVLHGELSAIYGALVAGQPHTLPPLATSHGDYAQWLLGWMHEPAYQNQLAYWKQRFAKTPPLRAAATDMPRRAGMSGQGGTQWISIEKPLADCLREAAAGMGVTLSMLTFGVYALLVSELIDTSTVVIANPVRGREAAETEGLLGFFNNVLPVSLEVDRCLPLPVFMRYVKQELLAMMDYQQVPFERLVAEPEFAGVKGAGLYQSMFSFQDARGRPQGIGLLYARQIHLLQRGATDDLGVWLMDKPHGIEGALVYNADIFLRETGAHLRDRYLELLGGVARTPTATLDEISAMGSSASAACVQRLANASRSPAAQTRDAQAAPVSPGNLRPEEAALARIWSVVMAIPQASIRTQDNFFDLGGDSLMTMRAVQMAENELGYRIEPRRYLFESLGQISASASAGPAAASQKKPASAPARGIGRVFGIWGRKG